MMVVDAYTSSSCRTTPTWFAGTVEQADDCGRHRGRVGAVREVTLLFWNPAMVTLGEFVQMNTQKIEGLKAQGFDGAIAHGQCPWSAKSSDFYVVFCPVQVEERL